MNAHTAQRVCGLPSRWSTANGKLGVILELTQLVGHQYAAQQIKCAAAVNSAATIEAKVIDAHNSTRTVISQG